MIQKLKNLLTLPTNELGKWSRFAVLQVRIWFHFGRLFIGVNRCLTQAAALAYHSIFGLVPLAIVSLMVFQMFPAFEGVSEKVKTFAYDQMNLTSIEYPVESDVDNGEGSPEQQTEPETISVANKLDELTQGYISKAHTGAITVVGLVLVIWASVALLTTIEKTFNNIFHVGTGRGFLHRLFNYWALLTLGPILLALAIYVSTQYAFKIGISQGFFVRIAPVVPFLISVLAFFLLYFFLPNTRVSPGAALWGAFVAALIWTLAKIGFGTYVTKFVPQFAVYGVLGIIPLTVMWIYLSWLIVLFGLQLTYATQNVKRLDAAEFSKARRQEQCFLANDQTVIRVMEYVLNAFERKDQKPVSVESIAYRMGMPTDFTEKILNRMVQSGLLCHTSEPSVGYVPSTDGTHITLDEISRAISEVSFAQPSAADATNMRDVFDELDKHLSRYTLKQVLNKDEDFATQDEVVETQQSDGDDVV
ncbi:MAG: YihY family inner membrane protein [Planctomycetes bacterium]|nr:YihY family inner membrane protein [Planctomycetota bacterium]